MIDKKLLEAIRPEINAALEAVGKKHGVSLKTGSCSYDADTATFKLLVMRLDEDGSAVTPEAADFKKYCGTYGLKPEHLNKSFQIPGGKKMTIVGLKTRATKNTIVVRDAAGGVYVMPHEHVCMLLDKAS